jgi:hypothetical protein
MRHSASSCAGPTRKTRRPPEVRGHRGGSARMLIARRQFAQRRRKNKINCESVLRGTTESCQDGTVGQAAIRRSARMAASCRRQPRLRAVLVPSIQNLHRRPIKLASEQLCERGRKKRVSADAFEQRQPGMKFHIVRRAKNLVSAPGAIQDRARARAKPRAKYAMPQVRLCFVAGLDGVVLCGGAPPKPGDLRKHEPHPMGAFLPLLQFSKRVRINRRQRDDEALQIKTSMGSHDTALNSATARCFLVQAGGRQTFHCSASKVSKLILLF